MFQTITKRDGREVPYDIEKIAVAINKAMEASGRRTAGEESRRLASVVEERLAAQFGDRSPGVEDIRTSSRLC